MTTNELWVAYGLPSVDKLAEMIATKIINDFRSVHSGSYLAQSVSSDENHVYIRAPRYNAIDVAMFGLDALEFNSNSSYAADLDENGGKIAVKSDEKRKGSMIGPGGKRYFYVQTGQWKGYVGKAIKDSVTRWLDKYDRN